ncbi:MAG: hypothetical protein Q7R83_02535 [bacterium]|nr:hypothetical protein [bacterium]
MGKQRSTRPQPTESATPSQGIAKICADLRQKKAALLAENRQVMLEMAKAGTTSLADRQKIQINLTEIRDIDETLRIARAA